MNLCLFDLDHTLLPIDSDHAWGEFIDPPRLGRRRRRSRAATTRSTRSTRPARSTSTPTSRFATAPLRERGAAAAGALRTRSFMREVIAPAHPAAGAGAGARAPGARRPGRDRHRHQRIRHRADRRRPSASTQLIAVRARARRRAAPSPARIARHADLPRRQGHARGAVAGRARAATGATSSASASTAIRINDLPLLERAHRPGGHQPDAGARGHRARARLAHPETVRMIKKFIDKLLGKTAAAARPARRRSASASRSPSAEHGIDPALVDERARQGGAARCRTPATRPTSSAARCATCCSACARRTSTSPPTPRPSRSRRLFRRAFIIGRRFRIVHVVYGRGREHEVIEVSTFRAYLDSGRRRAGGRQREDQQERTGRHEARGRRQRPRAARQRLGPADRRRRAARLHHQRDVLRPGDADRGRLPRRHQGRQEASCCA